MQGNSTEEDVIRATINWLNAVVVGLNFCPFAGREVKRGSIRYRVLREMGMEASLEALISECRFLDTHSETETTLIIFPDTLSDFDDFLDFLEIANQLMDEQGYEGIYQLASFHPDYLFADTDDKDPANYTNRSPYPMLHLIREASIEAALTSYPDPEQIPERNIQHARELGLARMQELLEQCIGPRKS